MTDTQAHTQNVYAKRAPARVPSKLALAQDNAPPPLISSVHYTHPIGLRNIKNDAAATFTAEEDEVENGKGKGWRGREKKGRKKRRLCLPSCTYYITTLNGMQV